MNKKNVELKVNKEVSEERVWKGNMRAVSLMSLLFVLFAKVVNYLWSNELVFAGLSVFLSFFVVLIVCKLIGVFVNGLFHRLLALFIFSFIVFIDSYNIEFLMLASFCFALILVLGAFDNHN